jgi:signal transduction histidine kinase
VAGDVHADLAIHNDTELIPDAAVSDDPRPTPVTPPPGQLPRGGSATVRFAVGIVLSLGVFLVLAYVLLQPPISDIADLGVFAGATALLSLGVGYGVYRTGWIHRSPSLAWTLLGGYFLAMILTFMNVGFSAVKMFASRHDLFLAAGLLVFAGGIALALGWFISAAIMESIGLVSRGAEAIASGHLEVRVAIPGRDEIAGLADAFNRMAERLQTSEARQKEMEATRRDLYAWIGHDLRTPLASITAMTEALADGVVDEPEGRARYLAAIRRDSHRLSSLVDGLFELSQIEAGGLALERQPNSARDLVSDTLEGFTELASRKGVTLAGHVEPGVDPVSLDARQISRVLSNLTSNAIRHTPEGGSVDWTVRRRNGDAVFEIEDTGVGIPPGDLPRVFESFYRGERSRSWEMGGSGLGLAIAKGIVEAHGGSIEVEPSSQGGARFRFTLPGAGRS